MPARPDLEVVDLRRGDRHLTLALATVTTPVLTADQTGWEGETVLVLGPSDVVGRARRHATGS